MKSIIPRVAMTKPSPNKPLFSPTACACGTIYQQFQTWNALLLSVPLITEPPLVLSSSSSSTSTPALTSTNHYSTTNVATVTGPWPAACLLAFQMPLVLVSFSANMVNIWQTWNLPCCPLSRGQIVRYIWTKRLPWSWLKMSQNWPSHDFFRESFFVELSFHRQWFCIFSRAVLFSHSVVWLHALCGLYWLV